jgi:hypothetical protein
VSVRVARLDVEAEASPLDPLVPHGLEGDTVYKGRDDDPDAAGGDDSQDNVGADARPADEEEAPVEQQDGDLAAREADGVEEEGVPLFLGNNKTRRLLAGPL